MKLYYSPGACSLAPHILLQDTGLPHELVRVDLRSSRTADGIDFAQITPKRAVPLLALDDGGVLSEGPIIAQYLCDRAGRTDLMPAAGTLARLRVMEWQNFITSELHKGYSPLFNSALSADAKAVLAAKLRGHFAWVSSQLADRDYLTGPTFTAADAYLYVVTSWAGLVDLNLSDLAPLQAFQARVQARPAVQAALRAEGLQR